MPSWLIATFSAIAGAAAWAVDRFKWGAPTKRGMKQFARDPRARKRMAGYFRDRAKAVAQAAFISDSKIRSNIEELLAGPHDPFDTPCQVLEKVGYRAQPALLAALDDPRCAPPGDDVPVLKNSPFETVVTLLARMGSESVLPRLVEALDSQVKKHRQIAAMNIATLGTQAAVPHALACLHHEDKDVRSYMHIGLGWAKDQASPPFRAALISALESIVAGESALNAYEDRGAARSLVYLDRAVAANVLSSDRCLRPENPHLSEVLDALNEIGQPAEPALLRPILAHAAGQSEYPWPRIRAEALKALTLSTPEESVRDVESALNDSDEQVREGAADSLLMLYKLPKPCRFLSFDDRLTSLPRPVQHVIAVVEFDYQVKNGGLSQYFFNSSGDHWPIVAEAFEAMDATACSEILSRAVAVVGHPSLDRDERITQYAKLSDPAEEQLDQLSTRFYKDEDHLDVRIARYMVKNAAVVRKSADLLEDDEE